MMSLVLFSVQHVRYADSTQHTAGAGSLLLTQLDCDTVRTYAPNSTDCLPLFPDYTASNNNNHSQEHNNVV